MARLSIKDAFKHWLNREAELATVRTPWAVEQCEEAYRAGRRDLLAEMRKKRATHNKEPKDGDDD